MLLAIDIGNTNITLGLMGEIPPGTVVETWRLATHRHATVDDYGLALVSLLDRASVALPEVRGVVVASVVPTLDPVFRLASERYLKQTALFVGPGVKTGVRVRYDNPAEVGADRVVNATAAYARVRRSCVIIDFGTATTFDCVNSRGDYLGGAIAPGPLAASDALALRAAKLPKFSDFRKPHRAIGTNTADSLSSGFYHGYVGMTKEILARVIHEMGGSPAVFVTGGLAPLFAPAIGVKLIEAPDLTLEGLYRIWTLNRAPRRKK